jgi:putative flippase GtrA
LIDRLVTSQFLRYATVGAAGFLVDWALLSLILKFFDLGLYIGRVFSFLGAATFAWAANRAFTFAPTNKNSPFAQWRRYMSVVTMGGLVNYGTYAVLIYFSATVEAWPVIGIAAGSICGLAFNYNGARRLVFGGDKEVTTEP